MKQKGFTLVEVLTVVVIVGVLASIALPMYTRAVERSRATEAMSAIKAINDAVYAYYAEQETCPTSFSQLVVDLPDTTTTGARSSVQGKFFRFDLHGATAFVPGTDTTNANCKGVLATRINGGRYAYTIWNPYTRGATGKALALQCAPVTASDTTSIAICESLGLYRSVGVDGSQAL